MNRWIIALIVIMAMNTVLYISLILTENSDEDER